MYEVFLLLLIISLGLSAYANARRADIWSWKLFAKTALGTLVIGLAAGFFGIWLGRLMGPDHAGLATLCVVVVIAAGVIVLTCWMRPKKGPPF